MKVKVLGTVILQLLLLFMIGSAALAHEAVQPADDMAQLMDNAAQPDDEAALLATATGKAYVPMTLGSQWKYDYTYVFPKGGKDRTTLDMKIVSVTNGIYKLHSDWTQYGDYLGEFDNYYLVKSNRVLMTKYYDFNYSTKGTYSNGNLTLPGTIAAGRTESVSGKYTETKKLKKSSVGYKSTARVVKFEKITVPAGTFNTVRILNTTVWGDGYQSSSTRWYAKGVGLVKYLNINAYGGQTVYELKYYNIK